VSDQADVREVIAEINALTDVAAGVSRGGAHRGESATLIFRGPDSAEIGVELKIPWIVTVGDTRSLDDRYMRVWSLVTRLANQVERR
jgi:hypothetical protein